MKFEGHILSGEFDLQSNEFSLHQIKHIIVESVINESKFNHLFSYLKSHEDDNDGQVISLHDQVLVKLSKDEIKELISDLQTVQSYFRTF